MEFARIADRQAREVLAVLADPDVSAVAKEEEMARERAEVEALLQEVDRELAGQVRTESQRVNREVRGQARACRRADREVLRSLPVQLERGVATEGVEDEAA